MNKLLNKINYGDAVEGLKQIADESADVVIIDPPYNIGKDFIASKDYLPIKEYVKWSEQWIDESFRILKPNGTIYIYGFSEILARLSVLIEDKEHPLRWLIWHYTNKNVPSLNFWQRSHESIICTWKNKPIFNRDDVREEYTDTFLKNAAGKVRKSTAGRFSKGDKETVYNAHEGGALPRDVIKIPALAGGAGAAERWFYCEDCKNVYPPNALKEHKEHNTIKHPTQKPLLLTEKLLKAALPKGEKSTIVIPFSGSGSECVASQRMGHNFIAFDNSEMFVKLGNAWIQSVKEKQ